MNGLELARGLSERLLCPLLLGEPVRLVAPVGEARAVELGKSLPGTRMFKELEELRLAAARRWAPVDDLGDISAEEWLLIAALNDLLQLTNPDLVRGIWSLRNEQRLARLVDRLIDRAGPPRTVRAALSRHALFSRIVELSRLDTEVRWWVGSDKFVGNPPPERLLAWPKLRKVERSTEQVRLGDMAAPGVAPFEPLLERWLRATPLTTLGTAQQSGVPFRWTGSLLALTHVPPGRRLALRVLMASRDVTGALADLTQAMSDQLSDDELAFAHARYFIAEAAELQREFAA